MQAWLRANLPAEWRTDESWAAHTLEEDFEMRREWERDKALAGWAASIGRRSTAAAAAPPHEKAIYDEEMARARARTVNNLGLTFLARP